MFSVVVIWLICTWKTNLITICKTDIHTKKVNVRVGRIFDLSVRLIIYIKYVK